MIVATIQQKIILPYKQIDKGNTAPYVYATLLSENEVLTYKPSSGKFEVKVLSIQGHSHPFDLITDKPTTISGYGIIDSYTKNEVNTLISNLNLINYYTKDEVDNLISNISSNLTNYYTKIEINTSFYTKTQIDTSLANYYTKTQIDTNLTNYYIKDEIDTSFYTKTQIDTSLSNYYTKNEISDIFAGTTLKTGYNKTNWDNAYSWGNHALAGYLTSIPAHNHDTLYLKLTGGTLSGTLNGTAGNFQTLSASTSLNLNGRTLTIRTL